MTAVTTDLQQQPTGAGSSAPPLFNPFDPGFRADPYPFYDIIRRSEPVHVSPFGFTVLTRYDDVNRTLRGSEFSRDVEANAIDGSDPVREARRNAVRQRRAEGRGAKTILNLDPPDHTRLRRLVNLAFTPRAIERLRGRIQQLVDEVLDRAADLRSIELVDELAFPVPFRVISDLLDLPTERSEDIRNWSQALTLALEPTATPESLDAAEQASWMMSDYLGDLIERRRKHLGDDVLSALISVEEAGDRMSTAELRSFVILLYVAGHETTVNLIGNGMLALLNHRDELRRWRQDPSIGSAAVDELLRFDGPVQQTVRVPTEQVTYGDVTVQPGTMVMTILGAANHDPAVFDDPHTLRLDRPNAGRHLALSAGIHYCLGASLAKLEAEIAIGSLISRFSTIEMTATPTWRDRLTIRGVASLPLSLTP